MRVADAGTFGGDDEVAGHGQLQSAGHRQAIQRGDGGFGAHAQTVHHAADEIEKLTHRIAWAGVASAALEPAFEIGAGAEASARTGQHDDADGRVPLATLGHIAQFGAHCLRQGIHRIGPVQRDPSHGATLLKADGQRELHRQGLLVYGVVSSACHAGWGINRAAVLRQ
jgi:hypothetical protein